MEDEQQKEEEFIYITDQCGRLWVKNVKIRNSGESIGTRDVYIITPAPDGKKLRSTKELTEYILETGYFEIDPKKLNFEVPDSMLGYQPVLPRNLHHNTKQFIQFISTNGSYVPNYMTRRPNRPRNTQTTQNTENNNPPIIMKLKKCHICDFYTYDFVIKKNKVFCQMCTFKTNQEKLLWYLKNNAGAPPVLDFEFKSIMKSTSMTKDEVKAFYSDELLKKAQEENPDDFQYSEDDFNEVDNADNISVASSVPSLEEKPDINELDKAMKDNNNELTNETENQPDHQDKGKTPLNGIKRSKNRTFSGEGSSLEKRVKIEPESPQKSPEPEPEPEMPKEAAPMVLIPQKSKDETEDLVQLIKKEIKKEVTEAEEEVDEDDIPELDSI